jgi:hypothetical protein
MSAKGKRNPGLGPGASVFIWRRRSVLRTPVEFVVHANLLVYRRSGIVLNGPSRFEQNEET